MAQNEPVKDAKKIVVDLTMTVEQAQQVKWVGKGPYEPIGVLLQSGQLNKRDLAWAVEGSNSQKCREASLTLLANWLGQPSTLESTQRFGPQVITGTNYLREQALDNIAEFSMGTGIVIGGILMFAVFGLPQQIAQWINFSNQGKIVVLVLSVIISIFALIFGGWYIYRQIKGKLDTYRSYSQGIEGEDRVVEQLRATLDNRWTIFRNLVLPNRKEDVDLVLVGPGGLWSVQVKSTKTTLRAQGMRWEVNTKNGWVPAAQNPATEVSSHAKQLNIYLQQNGIKRWVERAIAIATEQPVSYFESSEIPVWLPPTLEDRIKHLSTDNPPNEQEVQKIVETLKRLNDLQTNKS